MGRKKAKILPPNIPSVDIPPEEEKPQASEHNSGFSLIDSIYRFLIIKEPIGFSMLQKYKIKLALKIEHPWFYRFFLCFSMPLDAMQALLSLSAILIIIAIIILSFAKGLGLFDWLPKTVSAFQDAPTVASQMIPITNTKSSASFTCRISK